jgi:hypothetical protein
MIRNTGAARRNKAILKKYRCLYTRIYWGLLKKHYRHMWE